MTTDLEFYPYLPIRQHGVIGDRRTAAVIAADGTLNWLCLPNFDSSSLCSTLLDARRGGFWCFGPVRPEVGNQRYLENSAVLVTSWRTETGHLELCDFMPWPQNERPKDLENCRAIIRRLRCLDGEAEARLLISLKLDFDEMVLPTPVDQGIKFELGNQELGLWSSFPLNIGANSVKAGFKLRAGQEAWTVLSLGSGPEEWNIELVKQALKKTNAYWRNWARSVSYTGLRAKQVRRSALILHLSTYAPTGAVVASPTTSLPERLGGDRNYDYRYTWVRDASLTLSILAVLGKLGAAERYMDWLGKYCFTYDTAYQIVYGIDGRKDLTEQVREDLAGYANSRPVRFGNHAYSQRQLDSLGYLVECASSYLERGGKWKEGYWKLICRAVDYTIANWRLPDNGIWELGRQQHYVSSKVMAWVTLDRAIKIARRLNQTKDIDRWQRVREEIHAEVMERGWSEGLQAFRQYYDVDSLDASVLLIAVMDFLPATHPRVLATLEQLTMSLTIDGLTYRFVANEDLGQANPLPLDGFEGAFLPCTFWLAHTWAKAGQPEKAEAILEKVEALAGPTGLFTEEADAKTNSLLGNLPLLFSHAEYLGAVITLAQARPLDKLRWQIGELIRKVGHFLHLDKAE